VDTVRDPARERGNQSSASPVGIASGQPRLSMWHGALTIIRHRLERHLAQRNGSRVNATSPKPRRSSSPRSSRRMLSQFTDGGNHGCHRLIRPAHGRWLSQWWPDRRRRAVGIDRVDQLHIDRRSMTSLATQPCDDLGDRQRPSVSACCV
jgi:hypothetical protein